MNLVSNPLQASNPKLRETSSQLADYYDLHSEIQRAFDTGKKENTDLYAEYIIRIQKGDDGDTPTIDLYTPTTLSVVPGSADQKAKLIWEHGLTAGRKGGGGVGPENGAKSAVRRGASAIAGKPVEPMPGLFTIARRQRRARAGLLWLDSRDPMVAVVLAIEEYAPSAKG